MLVACGDRFVAVLAELRREESCGASLLEPGACRRAKVVYVRLPVTIKIALRRNIVRSPELYAGETSSARKQQVPCRIRRPEYCKIGPSVAIVIARHDDVSRIPKMNSRNRTGNAVCYVPVAL